MTHFVLHSPAAGPDRAGYAPLPPDARHIELAPGALRPIAAELAGAPDARAILVTRSAPTRIAALLADGAGAQSALSDWRKTAELELAVFRTNRRRILLLDADDLAAGPDQARTALQDWFDRGVIPQLSLRNDNQPGNVPAGRLIAELLCASAPGLHGLMSEQAASCVWITLAPPGPPVEAGMAAAEHLMTALADQDGVGMDVWRDALEAAQQNLRLALADDSTMRTGHDSLQDDHKALETYAAEIEGQLRAARREALDLRSMLHACEAQLERSERDRAAQLDLNASGQEELRRLSDRLEAFENRLLQVRAARNEDPAEHIDAEAEITRILEDAHNSERHRLELLEERERILSSTVWRLTAPFRWVVNTLGRRQ